MRIRRLHFRLRLTALNAVVALAVALFGSAGTAVAQTRVPSYGPPASAMMQGYEAHVFRTFQLVVSAFVPIAQLKEILPPGFTALATPAGSDTAQIAISFIFYQRSERPTGVDGPASAMVVTSVVRNSLLGRNESVLLANEQNNPASVANANTLFGEGTARVAEVKALIEEKEDSFRFRFEVADKALRLRLKLQAIAPSAVPSVAMQDPVPTPFRALNANVAGNSFVAANRYDATTVAITEDNFRLDVPDELRLPGGELTLVGLGATMSVQRWRDNYFKLDGQ